MALARGNESEGGTVTQWQGGQAEYELSTQDSGQCNCNSYFLASGVVPTVCCHVSQASVLDTEGR